MFDIKNVVIQAQKRIESYIRHTPLRYSQSMSERCGAQVYLKLENLQHTSSFKARGAFNKLLTLSNQQKEKGVVAASTGNHGAAVAYGLQQLKIKGIIFVPKNASPTKLNNIKTYGAQVRLYGNDCGETEIYARNYAKEKEMIYISPYNDQQVIAGQGTIGYEILKACDIDAIFVAVGGGGLISGIAGYVKAINPKIEIIACSPQNSAVMAKSVKAGKITHYNNKPTLSDGTAGNLNPDAITFSLCQQYVDDYILVSEDEIKEAMTQFMEMEHMLIEGSVGVTIAAMFKEKKKFKNKKIAAIICGANIGMELLRTVIC